MVSYELSRWEVGSDYNPAEAGISFEIGEEEKIKPGDYRIVREVFIDEKLTKSAGYAEHIFNVQNSIE